MTVKQINGWWEVGYDNDREYYTDWSLRYKWCVGLLDNSSWGVREPCQDNAYHNNQRAAWLFKNEKVALMFVLKWA